MIKHCVNCLHLQDMSGKYCDDCGVRLKNWDNEMLPMVTRLQGIIEDLKKEIIMLTNASECEYCTDIDTDCKSCTKLMEVSNEGDEVNNGSPVSDTTNELRTGERSCAPGE